MIRTAAVEKKYGWRAYFGFTDGTPPHSGGR
jgi:hypothetical protein